MFAYNSVRFASLATKKFFEPQDDLQFFKIIFPKASGV